MRLISFTLFSLSFLLLAAIVPVFGQPTAVKSTPKYDYESVPGDPLGVKIYTMQNGMKIYMSVNKDEPRVFTNIAVRAGSKHDPADATGLAHYLEHMMFKGTDKIGSLNWEQEKMLLENIAVTYEQHRREKDPEKRKELYNKIDRLSNKAAGLVAANEYDKLVASLGAQSTNAYTWVEQTVYVNDVPTNELGRWLKLEGERFKQVVLRLFHTELEAVYEEFNINQDRDFRKVYQSMRKTLFPSHPYGTQTTIGKGEHLKNPSHYEIKDYFNKYYVPNNMAILLAGDFNPDEVVAMAEEHFGSYTKKKLPKFIFPPQPELTEPVEIEVFGQESEYVSLAWRLNGVNTSDPVLAMLVKGILYNQQAGLMDLDLVQKQSILSGYAWNWLYEDFSVLGMNGEPRERQSLEEVKTLLLGEMEKLKNGDFEEWLVAAVIKDMKLGDIRSNESNGSRARKMTNAFILGLNWQDYVRRFETMQSYKKQDIIDFAKAHFNDNYVVVYKRNGEDKKAMKVEKPAITPVSLNREEKSTFAEAFLAEKSPRISPAFLEYKDAIATDKLKGGVQFDYIKNESNPTFSLYYILEMGSSSDPLLSMAINYLPYLGTSEYSPEALQQEFFRLGLYFDVFASQDRVYVYLSGLEESLVPGLQLFEHILGNVKPDEEALGNMVKDILAERDNAKKNKRTVLRSAMASYAKYGAISPFTDKLSQEKLESIKPADLIDRIKALTSYEHTVFFYGPQEKNLVKDILNKYHLIPSNLKPLLPAKKYPEIDIDETEVYFVDFPMVQAEVLMLSKGTNQYNLEETIKAELYNNYFGFGLSSVVFQEIRESKALAYSAYAYYGSPSKKDRSHYLQAYVGTQADKMPEAIPALRGILEDMPVSEVQIENAKTSLIKNYETNRVTRSGIYWDYLDNKDLGYDRDIRADKYKGIQAMSVEDLNQFHAKHVKGRKYKILVLAQKDSINFEYLKSLGKVTELSLEQVFGY